MDEIIKEKEDVYVCIKPAFLNKEIEHVLLTSNTWRIII